MSILLTDINCYFLSACYENNQQLYNTYYVSRTKHLTHVNSANPPDNTRR